MKKKGLIIATIVMVLVLAVSLTTATYAWFTADSKATITSISIGTADASEVLIGLEKTGTIGTTTEDDYYSGDCSFSGLAVTGEDGFGTNITPAISMAELSKAIGTGVAGTSVDASWDSSHAIVKANGDDSAAANKVTVTSIEAATANADYIDWVIGFYATIDNIHEIKLNITINPTSTKKTLGLLAALHIRYAWNDGAMTEVDLYGTGNKQSTNKNALVSTGLPTGATVYSNAQGTTTTLGALLSNSDSTVINSGALNYVISITAGNNASDVFEQYSINQLHLQMYVAGYDTDCVNAALGASSGIYFTITNSNYEP